jgi:hypothetical protein
MKGAVSETPAEAADLFRVAPERFIVERDALVKQLRADGRDEDAAAVKALRKPTAVVWGLNQLASRDPDGLTRLFDAGRTLRAAQQAALTGKGGEELVGAAAARRAAVTQLTTSAVTILEEVGQRGANQTDAIASALEAASTDPAAGADLAAGTLQKLPAATGDLGFGDIPTIATVGGGGVAQPQAAKRADLPRLRRELDAARKTATTRRATADRSAAQLGDLTERLERLRAEHADAESAALEAELEAERAARRLDEEG